LDPIDFDWIHPAVSSFVASDMAKVSCNVSTNDIEDLVFSSDSEEQCTSNVSAVEHSDDIVATNEAWNNRKNENRDTVIQLHISNRALNHVVYLMSYQTRFFII
jgi:hypothetical protein